MMKRCIIGWTLLLSLFLLCIELPAAVPGKAESPYPGFQGFEKFVEDGMKEWKVPGLAIAIVKDGKVMYEKGFGYRDMKKGLPVTPNTIFGIGSCTKAFTSLAVGMLVDKGVIHWDRPVRDYVSWFRMYDEYVTSHITLRDFLSHRSGLPRYDTLLAFNMPKNRLELVFRMRFLEPNKGFRSAFEYSNLPYIATGYVMEQATGKSWEALIKESILVPLSMAETSVSVNELKVTQEVALPHKEIKGELKEVSFLSAPVLGPAGSIHSTTRDMVKWLLLHLNKGKLGEKEIIPERILSEVLRPQVVSGIMETKDVSFSCYALGWGVQMYRGNLLLSHDGELEGFHSTVALLPGTQTGIVVFTNRSGENFLSRVVALNAIDRLLGEKELPWGEHYKEKIERSKDARERTRKEKEQNRKTGTKPSHDLEAYAGRYEHPAYGRMSISAENGTLKLIHGTASYPLRHYHYESFEMADEPNHILTFDTNIRGEVQSFSIPIEPTVREVIFTRAKENR
jgi:CubicO group peptidase (beta-lactamase class C family)